MATTSRGDSGTPPPPQQAAEVAEPKSEARLLLEALKRYEQGDFTALLELDEASKAKEDGVYAEIAEVFNRIVGSSDAMCRELERVHIAVGKQGDFSQHITLEAKGSWGSCLASANSLIDNVMEPMVVVRDAIGATAHGDLVSALALLHDTPVRFDGFPSSVLRACTPAVIWALRLVITRGCIGLHSSVIPDIF